MKKLIALAAAVALAAFALAGCTSNQQSEPQKQIPAGMTESAFDMGTEVHDITSQSLMHELDDQAVRAKIQKAIDGDRIDKTSRQDMRVSVMCMNEYMCFTGTFQMEDLADYNDDLQYTLATGEFAEDWRGLDKHLMDAVENK